MENTDIYKITEITKKSHKFYCQQCDYKCSRPSEWKRHMLRLKHTTETLGNNEETTNQNTYECLNCLRMFKTNSGLWKHKKLCKPQELIALTDQQENNSLEESLKALLQPLEEKLLAIESEKLLAIQTANPNADIAMLPEIIKQSQEFQMQMFQQMMEFMKQQCQTNMTTNNNNSHNTNNYTQFNLQVYLNETCKNAMNIDKFLDFLEPTIEELEATAHLGYVEGISRIIMRGFKNLEEYELPFHCTDLKREHIYVKNPDDEWVEERDEKPLLLRFIKEVARKSFKNITAWQKQNPNWANYHSKQNDLFNKIVGNSMSGATEEEQQENYEKIMKNIMKNITIDKSKKNSK